MELEAVAVRIENLDGRVKRVEEVVNDHSDAIQGASDFIRDYRAVESERAYQQTLQHQENSRKLDQINFKMGVKTFWATLVGAIGTVAGVLVAIATIWFMVYMSHHAAIEPLELFRHMRADLLYALSNTQQSGSELAVHW